MTFSIPVTVVSCDNKTAGAITYWKNLNPTTVPCSAKSSRRRSLLVPLKNDIIQQHSRYLSDQTDRRS